ncbi:MAG: manganese-binding transcriptional regulator MntR [Planctomycetaceae bacterium]|nr:manganese-binding transcriptional regulator MntR [Planctomycetaceae bacterium]
MCNVHQRIRADHATEMAEDYVEAIADVVDRHGVCRASDLVRLFRVTHATVNNTVGRLVRDGFVTTEPYQPLNLTRKGRTLASKCRERHEIVRVFLLALGISEATAIADSEGIEHHVSAETLQAMSQFLKTQQFSRAD